MPVHFFVQGIMTRRTVTFGDAIDFLDIAIDARKQVVLDLFQALVQVGCISPALIIKLKQPLDGLLELFAGRAVAIEEAV